MSEATDKQLEEALPCNMRCSPGITHSVHCFAARRLAVRALTDALIAGAVRQAIENYCGHPWPDGKPLPETCPKCDEIVNSVLAAARLALEEREKYLLRKENGAFTQRVLDEVLIQGDCGVSGHFKFQMNGSSCISCQREAKLIADTRDSALDEAAEALSRVQHVAGNVKLILGLKRAQGGASRDDS